jgi:DNA gyrase subunit A
VPGPDLPTGAQLLGMTEVRAAVRDRPRRRAHAGHADVEPLLRGKSQITVTEMPYGVGAERVIAKVKELVTGKKLQGISDIKDLTDRHRGTQLVIEVKAGFNPQAVLAELYRLTPLEESFGINNLALVDGQPRTLGLEGAAAGLPRPPGRRRHAALALPAAQGAGAGAPGRGAAAGLAHIDEVVRIIRASRTSRGARQLVSADRADRRAGRLRPRHAAAPPGRAGGRSSCEPSWPSCARRSPSWRRSWPTRPAARVIADELAEVAAEHGTPAAHGAGRRRPQGAGHGPEREPRGRRRAGRRPAEQRRLVARTPVDAPPSRAAAARPSAPATTRSSRSPAPPPRARRAS